VADYGKDDTGDATHWIVRGGKRVAIAEMTSVHLLNVVSYLHKKHRQSLDEQAKAYATDPTVDGVKGIPPADSHPAYGGLMKEVKRRGGLGHMLDLFLRETLGKYA
jgi:hypothetical protein